MTISIINRQFREYYINYALFFLKAWFFFPKSPQETYFVHSILINKGDRFILLIAS